MTAQEARVAQERFTKFAVLERRLAELSQTLGEFNRDDPAGPCGQGPFTGNTRESRRVQSLHIIFTATRGGAPPVEIKVNNLMIEAYEFARGIKEQLSRQMDEIRKAMKEI